MLVDTLRQAVPASAQHICVDMQRLFAAPSPWALPWLPRTVPNVVRICERATAQTVFTRFIPADRPGEGQGRWRDYWIRWGELTLAEAGPSIVELVEPLRRFAPPAQIVDKPVYSPWLGSRLQALMLQRRADTLVITGGETDMCVAATVLGAIDYGYRTILVADAVCSVSDEAHEAMLRLFSQRYSQHVEVTTVHALMDAARW